MAKHTSRGSRTDGGRHRTSDKNHTSGRSALSQKSTSTVRDKTLGQSAASQKSSSTPRRSTARASAALSSAPGGTSVKDAVKPAARGQGRSATRAAPGAVGPAERHLDSAPRGGPEIVRPGRAGQARPAPDRPPARSPLRQAFLDRVVALATRMADRAPDDVLASALAEATPLGTVATAMSAFVVDERALDAQDRALAAARARGAQFMAELLTRAGGAYTAEQLAEVLGKVGGRQTIAAGRASNRYFGLPTAAGYAYPRLQVTEAGAPLRGLRDFLDAVALPDPWMKLVLLLDPAPQLEGRTPLEALRSGNVSGAVAVAHAYGSHGA
jgi:hypothetical protein